MKLVAIVEAKRESLRAKDRFERTLAAVQHRLSPGNLAEEAWDGVKDKSADMAEGALQAVKSRPKAVSLAIGAFALFLARAPLKRAVTRLVSGGGDENGNDSDGAELSVTEGVD
jgi:hypothetical protein